MERWLKSVAVVTGASSGIGAAIAKDLANAGLIVVALARRIERVDEIRAGLSPEVQPNFYSIKCDITDRKAVNETFDWVEENLGGIDILINNAGTLFSGQIVNADIDKMQNVIQTNIMGVVLCTQRAFKSMKARNVDGHIVNINSITGHYVLNLPEPHMMNVYPASKHAVTAINEILRQEVRDLGTKIKVTSISPGLVDTEILPSYLRELNMLRSEDISNAILFVLSTPPHVQVHELTIKPVGELF